MPKWTENQIDAIESTDGSVLVSASAGSGKTAVLVERVIRRITDEENPVLADRLLIVTYTRAAAAEMKERINKKLSELIRQNPGNVFLRNQQNRLKRAYISTIHSFCSEIIKEHFYLLNISKDFRIAEDTEIKMLKTDAIEYVLEKEYDSKNKNFHELVESFSDNKNDEKLKAVVFRLYEFLRSHPFPDEWLSEKKSYYNADTSLSDTIWSKRIYTHVNQAIDYCRNLIKNIYKSPLLTEDKESDVYLKLEAKLLPVLHDDLMYLENVQQIIIDGTWDDLREIILNFSPDRLPALKTIAGEEFKNYVSKFRDEYKETIKSLAKLFPVSEKDFYDELGVLQPIVNEMFDFVAKFSYKLDELKSERNIHDFSDLEHLTLKLLVKKENGQIICTDEAKKIATNFDEVMVDEYQDANEVQDTIFWALSGMDKNLFVVGDVKQSIYSFRQAMPEIFVGRSSAYNKFNIDNPEYPAKIILEKNFRSRKEVTDSVNFIFNCLMSEDCGGVNYNDEQLVCGADYNEVDTPKVSVNLLDYNKNEYEEESLQEADFIAEKIYKIMREGSVFEDGKARPPMFSDFVILLRNANDVAPDYVNRLKKWGIPANSVVSEKFLTAREIIILINLLKVIDNPIQDIPLLSVLMSPVYGFTADEMAEIRAEERHSSIYSTILNHRNDFDGKVERFLTELENFRTYSIAKPVHLLINKIFEDTSYPALLSGIYSSDVHVNNILLFQEYAKNFENNGYRGLSAFITFIDGVIKQNGDFSGSEHSGGENNSVSVMSIHHSKGLEFPFVFLANTHKQFVNDTNENVLIHKDIGFTLKKRNHINHTAINTLPRVAAALEITRSKKSEELRVLYVALTRAREELHIICTTEKAEKYLKNCAKKITDTQVIDSFTVGNATRMSDWLIHCALLHPNAYKFRNICDIAGKNAEYNPAPDWEFNFVSDSNSCDSLPDFTSDKTVSTEDTDDSIESIIESRLKFVYKNKDLSLLPSKVSVSELSHSETSERFSKILSRPDFMSEKSMTAVERGTATHNILQYMDFSSAVVDINLELERMQKSGYITEIQKNVVDINSIRKFLNSSIVEDVIKSETVYREFKFNIVIRAGDYLDNIPDSVSDEEVILQGAVDLAYVKDNNLVIVDYKTDRVKDIRELKELYSKQVELYKIAMEKCTPYKVSTCLIYSIRLGDFIEV